jgi:cation transport protein ChaC
MDISNSLKNLAPQSNLWVFGYGSLMWNPEFEYEESNIARIYGFHRRLCLWSVRYRGTDENPGLVMGMASGGSCLGVVFKVADANIQPTLEYLYEREMISDAYRPVIKPVHLSGGGVRKALTFVSKPGHPQFAPKMSIETITDITSRAFGPRGTNSEYIINTARHLDSIGIFNTEIHQVATQLKNCE